MGSDRKRKAREAFDAWADELGDAGGTALAAGPVRTVSPTAKRASKKAGPIGRTAARIDDTKDVVVAKSKRLAQAIRSKAAGATGVVKAATKKVAKAAKPSRDAGRTRQNRG